MAVRLTERKKKPPDEAGGSDFVLVVAG